MGEKGYPRPATCGTCGGSGVIYRNEKDGVKEYTCPTCGGKGTR